MSLQEKLFADYMQAMKDKDVSKKDIKLCNRTDKIKIELQKI